MGVGTPTQRNVAMMAAGVVGAFALGMFSPAIGVGIGGGIASVGLTRQLASSTASPALPPAQPVAGLGMGNGIDMEGIGRVQPGGIHGVYANDPDEIGMVVNDYG